jgi:tRNA A37 methylthiotransferase MiaB
MNNQVELAIRKDRNAILQALFKETARSYRQQFIGRKFPVLWEATSQLSDLGWQLEGLTDNYIRVKAVAPEPRWNRLDSVELIENGTDGLRGLILDME